MLAVVHHGGAISNSDNNNNNNNNNNKNNVENSFEPSNQQQNHNSYQTQPKQLSEQYYNADLNPRQAIRNNIHETCNCLSLRCAEQIPCPKNPSPPLLSLSPSWPCHSMFF